MTYTKAGKMYGRTWDGRLEEAPNEQRPDTIICRRVIDFPGKKAPTGATIGVCDRCGADIAYNAKKFPDMPHVCMQCADIKPLPIGD